MGILTKAQMVAEVTSMISRSDMSTLIEGYIDRSYLDLCMYQRFHEMDTKGTVTLLSGNNTVAVPADLHTPFYLQYGADDVIVFKDIIMVRNEYHTSSSGLPIMFARHGNLFYFDKNADQDYAMDLYYRKRATTFASGAVSAIGSEWDEAIIISAAAKAFRKLRQFEVSTQLRQEYYAYVKGHLPEDELDETSFNETMAGDIDGDAAFGW